MLLEEALKILPQIKEKYHQYGVEWFLIQTDSFYGECDIEEDDYSIDFKNRVIYLKQTEGM